MRVLLDARPLQGATGRRGVGAYVRRLAEGLAAADPEIELVMLTDGRLGPLVAPPEHPRIAWPPPCRGGGPALLRGLAAGPAWTRRAGADLVHATFLAPPRPAPRVPLVATVHDLIPLDHPSSFPLRQRIAFRLSLALAARAERVIAVSRRTAQRLERRLRVEARRIDVIPPPVDVGRFGSSPRRGLDGVASPYVIHLGGFDPLKGVVDLLLPAFSLLAARRPGLSLVLTGDGAGRSAAERAAADLGVRDAARFVGHLGGEAHVAAVAGAAALVVSSHEEGFGLPVVEAMAAGVPVAIGPAASSREAAAGLAHCAEQETPSALADAIARALDDGGPESPRAAARRHHAASFSPARIGARVVACYRAALPGGGA